MGSRVDLHNRLVEVLENLGFQPNVYFDPPASIQLKYPCIVYSRDSDQPFYADNLLYFNKFRYSLTVINKNPDSTIHEELMKLPLCRYSRHFVSDNLHHDICDIYY